jgi:hypothetical protein
MRSLLVWKKWASTTPVSTRSLVLFSHSVRLRNQFMSEIDTNAIFVVLHPYYKLAYIKLQWGGPEEQAAEMAAGNYDAKDWHDEAKQIVERTVSCLFLSTQYHTDSYKDVSVL